MSYNAIVKKVLDNIISEVNKENNMDRIKKNVIEPIIHNTMYQLYPYMAIFDQDHGGQGSRPFLPALICPGNPISTHFNAS